MKTIIIAAGGTGGHLYPGVALARTVVARGCKPIFIVRKNDMCCAILKREGFAFEEIPARGMPRRISLQLVVFLYALIRSFFAALVLVRRLNPTAVVGMGGYISFPVIVAAKLSKIPTVIHEQNYLPGLANRVLARFASRVAVTFAGSRSFFSEQRTVVTGNPVRRELFGVEGDAARERLHLAPGKCTVLVFGGSQGAYAVNHAVTESYALLPSTAQNKIQFLHIAGNKGYEKISAQFREKKIPGVVLPYLNEIGDAYAVADIVICRAGATTISELEILGTPVILVPFPHATGNHQEFNARVLVDSGQGVMIRERELSPQVLARELIVRMNDSSSLHRTIKISAVLPQELLADTVLSLI